MGREEGRGMSGKGGGGGARVGREEGRGMSGKGGGEGHEWEGRRGGA